MQQIEIENMNKLLVKIEKKAAVFKNHITFPISTNCFAFFLQLIFRNNYSLTTHVKNYSQGINDLFIFKPLLFSMCKMSESLQFMGPYKPFSCKHYNIRNVYQFIKQKNNWILSINILLIHTGLLYLNTMNSQEFFSHFLNVYQPPVRMTGTYNFRLRQGDRSEFLLST